MRPLCPVCQQRRSPRIYAGVPVPCGACAHAKRLAYWQQRDDERDFSEAEIERRYLRAVHAKNPRKARLLQERAA